MSFDHLKALLNPNKSKIVLLILDGLGGLPMEANGQSALEAATTPVMDRLAAEGSLGSIVPIRPGVTPGSGPAHLSLFGYDPLKYLVGRGALEATGVGIELRPGDVAARGNFCTLDENGKISDRRAGRISSKKAKPLVEKLRSISIDGVEITLQHLREYRFVLMLRGENLDADIHDTDPQKVGMAPLKAKGNNPQAVNTAALFRQWISAAETILSDEKQANGVTLRGFGTDPILPKYRDIFALQAACVAVYPMYRGVSKLVGMDMIDFNGESPDEEFEALKSIWKKYDFFFVHIKKTDSMGEDGNFEGKKEVIESVDQALHKILDLKPDVLIITGDHSTPAKMRSHSWHPVPLLLWAPERGLADHHQSFGERNCVAGGLGIFHATEILPLALAHGGRLNKFGA